MNNALEFLTRRLGAAAVAFALCAGLAQATINLTTIPSSPINNGESPAVAAEVVSSKTVDKVFLQYRFKDAKAPGYPDIEWTDWHNQEMTPGEENEYNGFIPILPAGQVDWNICATYTDGSSEGKIENIDADSYDYFHDMRGDPATAAAANTNGDNVAVSNWGWVQDTSVGGTVASGTYKGTPTSTNFYAIAPSGSRWEASGVGWAANYGQANRVPHQSGSVGVGAGLAYPVLYFYNISTNNATGAVPFIRTPRLEHGLGTFSFGAMNVAGTTSKLMVQVAYTDGEPADDEWRDIEEYSLPDIKNYWFTNVVNDIAVTYARILRTEKNTEASGILNGFIGIDDIRVIPPAQETRTVVIADTLTYNRLHDMRGDSTTATAARTNGEAVAVSDWGWRQDTSVGGTIASGTYRGTSTSTNFYAIAPNGSRWEANGVGWAANYGAANRLPHQGGSLGVGDGLTYPVLYFYNISTNSSGKYIAFIRTPKLEHGLGTFSFGVMNLSGITSKLMVQVAYTDGEPAEDDWHNVKEYPLLDETNYWFTNVINDIAVTYARILRTEKNTEASGILNGFVGIDDICVTPPTPDLVMKERLRNPGYPSIDQEISVRCLVSNVYERIPAINRKVSVHYSLETSETNSVFNWQSTDLTYQYEAEYEAKGWSLYEGKIPAQGLAGWLHYFFRCDFDGYYYVSREVNGMASPEYLYQRDAAQTNRYSSADGELYYSTTNDPPSGIRANGDRHLLSEVRASRSRYNKIEILRIVDGIEQDREEMTLVGDDTWQASVPVQTGTVVEAYFVGKECYRDDAESFLEDDIFYGDNDQDEGEEDYSYETPASGTPDRQEANTNKLTAIKINVSKKGFLVYRLKDSNTDGDLNYSVRRGVFQNFDKWVLTDQHYTDALEGTGVGKMETSFDKDKWNWVKTYGFSSAIGTDFLDIISNVREDVPPKAVEFNPSEESTPSDWVLKDFRITNERVTNNAAAFRDAGGSYIGNSNTVVQLRPGGSVRNDGDTVPQGTGSVTTRMRCAINDNSKAICTNEYNSSSPLVVSTAFSIPAADRANSHYFASIVFDFQNTNNYHELRFTRGDATNANDDRMRLELFETYNGDSRWIGGLSTNSINGTQNHDIRLDNTTFFVEAQISKSGSGLTVKLNKMQTASKPEAKDNEKKNVSGWNGQTITATSPFASIGQVGVTAYDCAPKFHYLVISNGVSDVFEAYSKSPWPSNNRTVPTFAQQSGRIFFGGTDYTTGNEQSPKWYLDGGGALSRRIPKKTINLYTRPYAAGSEGQGSDTLADTRTLNTLKFTECSWSDVNKWQKVISIIEVSSTDADENCVVVDSVSATPWRAGTRPPQEHDYPDAYGFTSEKEQNALARSSGYSDNWVIFEGWAMTNTAAKTPSAAAAAAFRKSQANPSLVQALYSPTMTNGIGTVRFDFHVTGQFGSGDKIVYAIEYTDAPLGNNVGDFENGSETAAVYTNRVGETGSMSCDVRVNYGYEEDDPTTPLKMRMRIRVLSEAEGTSPEATLWLDNIFVNDSPEETEDMWKMYNGRLATAEYEAADPKGDFTRIYGGSGTSLYLNNSPDDGIPDRAEPYWQKYPYLQAPKMEEGIGEIGFVYRVYDDDSASGSSPTGCVHIVVSDDESKPFSEWISVTNFFVTKSGYLPFDNEDYFDTTNYFVRIFTETNNGFSRVCFDNVVVMEPSRPGYKIVKVSLIPEYPVTEDGEVRLEARIGQFSQSPSNICLYVSYVTSSNTWGYGNWWKPSYKADSPATIMLDQVGNTRVYRTPDGKGLPATPDLANGVVQYVVWGTHHKVPEEYDGNDVIFETGIFKNPQKYGAVDLNKTYGTTNNVKPYAKDSVTPYYFIFSSRPGSVWINEIWNMHATTTASKTYPDGSPGYEFVELGGVGGTDITGWQLKIYMSESATAKTNIVFGSMKIPNGDDGWGFIVLGDVGITNSPAFTNTPRNQVTIMEFPGTKHTTRDSFNNAAVAFELLRDNGIIEQTLYVKTSESSATKPYPWNSKVANSLTYWLHPAKSDTDKAKSRSYSLVKRLFDDAGNPTSELIAHMNKIGFASSKIPQVAYTNLVAGTAGKAREWWWYPADPTPGRANELQDFEPLSADTFLLDSSIWKGEGHGTQNGKTGDIVIPVNSGASTQIVYVASSWYKIIALESNDKPVSAAVGQDSYTFYIPSMDGKVVNKVSFGLKDPSDLKFPWSDLTKKILKWFSKRGFSEEAIARLFDKDGNEIENGDGDTYTINEEYLMDTDPTVRTKVDAQTDSISIDGDSVTIGVGLARTDNVESDDSGGTNVISDINGVVNIYGVAELADFGTANETNIATVAGSFANTNKVDTTFGTGSSGVRFFKWRLDDNADEEVEEEE